MQRFVFYAQKPMEKGKEVEEKGKGKETGKDYSGDDK